MTAQIGMTLALNTKIVKSLIFFPHPPPLNANAYQLKNENFLFHQKKSNYYSGNYKNYQPEILQG